MLAEQAYEDVTGGYGEISTCCMCGTQPEALPLENRKNVAQNKLISLPVYAVSIPCLSASSLTSACLPVFVY